MPNEDKILSLGRLDTKQMPSLQQQFFRSGTPGGNIRSGLTYTGPGGSYTFSETMDQRKPSGRDKFAVKSPDVYSEGTFDIKTSPKTYDDAVQREERKQDIFDPSNITEEALGARNRGDSQGVIETVKNAIKANEGNNMAIDNLVSQFGNLDPSIAELAGRTKRGVGEIGEIKRRDVEDFRGTPTTLPPPEFVFDYMPGSLGGPKGTIPEIANVPEIDSSGIPFVDPNEFDDGAMRDQTLSTVTRNINEAKRRENEAKRRDNEFVGSPLEREDPFDPNVGGITSATTPLTLRRGKDNEIEGVSLKDMEGLYGLPKGQAKGAAPTRLGLGDIVLGPIEELGGKIAGGIGLPEGLSKIVSPLTTFGKGILNLPGGITRAKIADAITDGKFTDIFGREFPVRSDQIIRNDRTGDITGIRNPSDGPLAGKVAIGFDPDDIDLYQGDDGQASTPLIRRVKPEEAPKAATGPSVPNVFGSGQPAVTQTVEETPTVVASPFAPASSAIRPITFDTGQLNELIKLLTGVPARPIVSAANGGLIRAVDDFLATG